MKWMYRGSRILKAAGVVFLCVSLALGLYALANSGGAWNRLKKEGLQEYRVRTTLVDKLRFDDLYFTALSRASASREREESVRIEKIRPLFGRFFSAMEAAALAEEAQAIRDAAAYLENDLDEAAFLEHFGAAEEIQGSQELREFFEYIDKLSAPPAKGKVAALKPASQEPFFTEYYEAFSAEHGEEAGSWYEFMASVTAMLQAEEAAGLPVKDIRAWMSGSFTYENYLAQLETVRAQERSELSDNFATELKDLYEKREAGEAVDFEALLQKAAGTLAEKYPDQNLGGDGSLLFALCDVLVPSSESSDGADSPAFLLSGSFDGSYNALADALRERAKASGAGVSAVETGFLRNILSEADSRSSIALVAIFWALVSKYLPMLAAAIVMLIAGSLLRRNMSRHILKARTGAEENGTRTAFRTGTGRNESGTPTGEASGSMPGADDPDVLLKVEHLKQYFKSAGVVTKAVDDISFFIRKGEVFGLVGESGCGKTTTGRTIINLYDPTDGDVYFDGLRISSTLNGLPVLRSQIRQEYREKEAALKKTGKDQEARELKKELKRKLNEAEDHALESFAEKSRCVQLYRQKRLRELKEEYDREIGLLSGEAAAARTRRYETEKKLAAEDNVMTRMQMIFQDPIASINPRMTVRETIAEGLVVRGVKDKEYIDQRVYEMLELVGLVREHADRYPHEFSGGQRQRIGIARAIIMEPDLIIADEPISALDVSIQAQVINLLNDLRERMGLTILFIAHNLSVVKYFSDRIAVMYFGHIVELADSEDLFAHPLHPYTRSLLSAIPYPDPHYEKTRKRMVYDPARTHDYSVDKPSLREITPGHFIHCNDAEMEKYRKEMGL